MIDVVCKHDVSREPYVFSFDYKGETYRFCSMRCRRLFEATPGAYARALPRLWRQLVRFFRAEDKESGHSCC